MMNCFQVLLTNSSCGTTYRTVEGSPPIAGTFTLAVTLNGTSVDTAPLAYGANDAQVGRCKSTVSKPELKARLVFAISA